MDEPHSSQPAPELHAALARDTLGILKRNFRSAMASSQSTSGSGPGNPGIVDLEVAVLDVRPQPILNAIQVEIANPAGDGIRILLDLGLTLDFAMRLVGSAMRLRRLIP